MKLFIPFCLSDEYLWYEYWYLVMAYPSISDSTIICMLKRIFSAVLTRASSLPIFGSSALACLVWEASCDSLRLHTVHARVALWQGHGVVGRIYVGITQAIPAEVGWGPAKTRCPLPTLPPKKNKPPIMLGKIHKSGASCLGWSRTLNMAPTAQAVVYKVATSVLVHSSQSDSPSFSLQKQIVRMK